MKKIIALAALLVAIAGFSQSVVDTLQPIKLNEVKLRSDRYSQTT